MSKDAEHIIRLIAKFFELPCHYEYEDIDAYDFCNKVDEEYGIGWCEENCGKITNYDCWYRFFSLMARCENEQLEYGKDQDAKD